MKYTELIHTFHPSDLEVLATSHAEAFESARAFAENKAREHVAAWLRYVSEHVDAFEVFDCDVPESLPSSYLPSDFNFPTRGIAFAFTCSSKS